MDGVTHINIFSKGSTSLGQALSNFADTPIQTVDGDFRSIEGYWYWLNMPGDNYLRELHSIKAKNYGRAVKAADWKANALFKLKIYNAMLTKLILHPKILQEFQQNKLPFRHYYMFGSKVCEPKEGKWIIDMWTFLQGQL